MYARKAAALIKPFVVLGKFRIFSPNLLIRSFAHTLSQYAHGCDIACLQQSLEKRTASRSSPFFAPVADQNLAFTFRKILRPIASYIDGKVLPLPAPVPYFEVSGGSLSSRLLMPAIHGKRSRPAKFLRCNRSNLVYSFGLPQGSG
jgi:hypothetical protein